MRQIIRAHWIGDRAQTQSDTQKGGQEWKREDENYSWLAALNED